MRKEPSIETGALRDVPLEVKEPKDPLKEPKNGKDSKETKTKSAIKKPALLLNNNTSETIGES